MVGGQPRRIGRYEVVRPIAAGDTAELFLAKQTGLEGFERIVFIKRIRDELASEEAFVRAFLDEARLVAKLAHSNIVEVYDLGKDGDAYFIAMEYVQGRTLGRLAARAREVGAQLPPQFVARCVSEICAGVHYAHTMVDSNSLPQNIVHGAITPRKIIVSFTGVSKVRDFGIAKAATILAETHVDLFKGRYSYLSPEQIKRVPLDARSDVFALGVILYELVTGSHPFKRGNSILTLTAIAEERHTPIKKARRDLSEKLTETIDRALSKKRSNRFNTAEELQLALEDYLTEAPRCDSVEVRRLMKELFNDELVPGDGVLEIPGVGEVILPEGDAPTTARKFIVPDDTTTIDPRVNVPGDTDTEIAPLVDDATDFGKLSSDFDQEATAIPVPDAPTGQLGNLDDIENIDEIEVGFSAMISNPVVVDPAESSVSEISPISVPEFQHSEVSVSDPDVTGAIQDAFAEFAPAPSIPPDDTGLEVPAARPREADPIALPADALMPLDPSTDGGKPKREIKEIYRPGPQAPTEFRSDLAEQAAAALAGVVDAPVFIPTLPSIIRVRSDDDEPKVQVVAPQVFSVPPPPAAVKVSQPTPPPQKLVLPMPSEAPDPRLSESTGTMNVIEAVSASITPPAPPVATPPPAAQNGAAGLIAGLPPKLLLAVTGALLIVAFALLLLTLGGDGVRVNVRSTPEGAQITVNGQTQKDLTPCVFEGKAGATYQVRFEKEGFLPAYKTIIIPQGSRNVLVEVTLEK
jgi:serine/threonine-protein kinase